MENEKTKWKKSLPEETLTYGRGEQQKEEEAKPSVSHGREREREIKDLADRFVQF